MPSLDYALHAPHSSPAFNRLFGLTIIATSAADAISSSVISSRDFQLQQFSLHRIVGDAKRCHFLMARFTMSDERLWL